jgi:hypothetical protein
MHYSDQLPQSRLLLLLDKPKTNPLKGEPREVS